ncbi:DNA-binding domain-containing protein [Actibacterium ureilyticum]|uniref:HvfC/BufC N-terminal domain-containing protein n=1 Tax=Actibacterium ureilyticum TaxID=1590614 RepID=UPI000BAA97DC|nr:DNA-binding domain-containing protein [Actibacterium ureilyticum]
MSVGQTDFRTAILDARVAAPAGLVDPEGRPAGKRFDVYRNNVAVSLTEALKTAFPVIRKLLGDENFAGIAGLFLRQHPPTSPLLMFYGAEFPDFLAGFEPVRHLGYLADVARLELALRHSYHAADATPVAPQAFQDMTPQALMAARLRLAPAVQLLRSHWPIHAIWQFNQPQGGPKPEMRPESILITRPDYDPVPHLLPAGGGALVAALGDGQPLGNAVATATTKAPDFDLAATLGLLIGGGAITEILQEETP